MPVVSKVKFGWPRGHVLMTRVLVIAGCVLAVGLAAGATPALASTPCAPGSFSPTGQQPCTPAPPGSFVASTGAISATPCAIGTYQPNAGQLSCLPAPIGSFVSTTGATSPTACPTGTTTSTIGSTSVADCHAPTPITADQCKHGGWRLLADRNGTPFKNQGDCVSYVATGGRNLADGPPTSPATTPGAVPVAGSPSSGPSTPSAKAKGRRSRRHHRHGRHSRKASRRSVSHR